MIFSILDTDLYMRSMVTIITIGDITRVIKNPLVLVIKIGIGLFPPSPRPHGILKPWGLSPLSYPMQCGG
jgi:hypothetical protein